MSRLCFGVFLPFFVLINMNLVVIKASEDSYEEVMKGYENPQKRIQAQAKTQNQTATQAPPQRQTIGLNSQAKYPATPPKTKYALIAPSISPPPSWIYSTAMIEVTFNDGSFRRGLGTLLKNGYYLTSSEIIYHNRIVPKQIYAKMQDDFNAQIMCVSALSVKMLDLDAGLALLQTSHSVNGYCENQPISYYQDRIYKRFGIDVFASHKDIAPKTKVHYPYLNAQFIFIPQSTHLSKAATYYDFDRRKELVYGFEMNESSYEEFTYGKAFYDDKGVFLGIMSRAGVGYMPVFIHRAVVQDFLCLASEREVVDDDFIKQKCRALGKSRQRFFTDMKSRVSFY